MISILGVIDGLEGRIASALMVQITRLHVTKASICRVQMRSTLDHILRQLNPVLILRNYAFIIILKIMFLFASDTRRYTIYSPIIYSFSYSCVGTR
jgi:hypothetical protein